MALPCGLPQVTLEVGKACGQDWPTRLRISSW
jgi:hypothetical protein